MNAKHIALILFLAVAVAIVVSCLPIKPPVVDPPEPPVLTMKQRQKLLQDEFKKTGHMPRGGGYYVLVEEKP